MCALVGLPTKTTSSRLSMVIFHTMSVIILIIIIAIITVIMWPFTFLISL